jgi:hypothetical protein
MGEWRHRSTIPCPQHYRRTVVSFTPRPPYPRLRYRCPGGWVDSTDYLDDMEIILDPIGTRSLSPRSSDQFLYRLRFLGFQMFWEYSYWRSERKNRHNILYKTKYY